jgi:hypothetical protein
MLNSLANHGFIPRNGRNITVDDLIQGFVKSVNIAPNSTGPIAEIALTTSTTGNPDTFNLDDLKKHQGKILCPCTAREASGNEY